MYNSALFDVHLTLSFRVISVFTCRKTFDFGIPFRFFFGRIRWVVAEPLSSPVGLAWYVFFFLAAEPSLVRYFFF